VTLSDRTESVSVDSIVADCAIFFIIFLFLHVVYLSLKAEYVFNL